MKKIYFSMDCERLNGQTCVKGPVTQQESESSIVNFVERLQQFQSLIRSSGPVCELFITPAAAEMHAELFREMIDKGVIVAGLHIHVSSFRKYYNFTKKELSNLPYSEQWQVIQEAIADFTAQLQITPCSFRPGMAAANTETFQALVDLGITKGSCTVPGIKKELYNFDWSSSPKTPHIFEPSGFFNIPLNNNLWIDNRPNIKLFPLPLSQDLIAIYCHNWVNLSEGSCGMETLNKVLEKLASIKEPLALITSQN